MCQGSSCVTGERCMGHQCFSSLALNGDALVSQKGCFKVYEQSTMTCKTPPSRDQIVECCHGHLCNLNITVALPVQGTACRRRRRCSQSTRFCFVRFIFCRFSVSERFHHTLRLDARAHKRSRCAIQETITDTPSFIWAVAHTAPSYPVAVVKSEAHTQKKIKVSNPDRFCCLGGEVAQQGELCPG